MAHVQLKMQGFLYVFSLIGKLADASFTANLKIKMCDQSGCKPVQKRIALDATSNGTEKLITVSKDQLTLEYGGAGIGGPRVYLIEEEGVNKNTMLMLKGKEFTFDMNVSTMPCGFNAALYFVGMKENEGEAEKGMHYCDGQAVAGTFCAEMDVMEANTKAQQFTTHACIDECGSYNDGAVQCKKSTGGAAVCDRDGCGLNPFRYGPGSTYNTEGQNLKWYGEGKAYALDSSQLMTVVTQFHVDSGELANITRFYLQNGKRIDLPTLYVRPPTDGSHYGPFELPAIRADFCTDIYDRWNGNAGYSPLAQMGKNMEKGMVLAMSAWYSEEVYSGGRPAGGKTQTGMSWLDGINDWSGLKKAGPCDQTTTDTGTHHATFSDIRIGDIGTTGDYPAPPAPSPPAPSPPTTSPGPPSSGSCCWGGCSSGNCQAAWCGQSQSHCEGNCNGEWCPKEALLVNLV